VEQAIKQNQRFKKKQRAHQVVANDFAINASPGRVARSTGIRRCEMKFFPE
jgi:hypothetical protein